MSIDRLDYANIEVLCEVHDDEALARGSDRKFYGWLTFATGFVRQIGLDVEPSPSIPETFGTLSQRHRVCKRIGQSTQWKPKPLSRRVREDIEQASEGLGK